MHGLKPGDEIRIFENQQPVARTVCEPESASSPAGHRPPPCLGKAMIDYIADDFDEALEDMQESMQ